LNTVKREEEYLVDRRLVIKLFLTYVERDSKKEILELMARILNFPEDVREKIFQQHKQIGWVSSFIPSFTVKQNIKVKKSEEAFSDLWVDFLLKEAKSKEIEETNEKNKSILFDNKKTEKSAEFQLNLLTLESESLGIPETEYPTFIKMSSFEFVRLCKELTAMTEVVKIEVNDNLATFNYTGKMGSGKIKMKKK